MYFIQKEYKKNTNTHTENKKFHGISWHYMIWSVLFQERAKKELDNQEEQKLSVEKEIGSLAEQSSFLHTLYARHDELLKRSKQDTETKSEKIFAEYLAVTTGLFRKTNWKKVWTNMKS